MYKQITPVNDWFYIEYHNDKQCIYPVAAWALTENNSVIGLISTKGAQDNNGVSRLIAVAPHIVGKYIHTTELTKAQENALEHDNGIIEALTV